ncbi:MAG: hypothetical protein ACLSB9_19240 [Hydrogeniiclostridium mannosilyticum]
MGHRTKIAEGQYLHGLDAAEKLQTLVDAMAGASAQGLSDASLFILGEAAKRAPVDTGNLRGSGYVELDGQQVAKGAEGGAAPSPAPGPKTRPTPRSALTPSMPRTSTSRFTFPIKRRASKIFGICFG